ncbi:MAG: hypothetical protein SWQ30_06555 [Thermodesulfobacteriota bacterium]|nr:hypothetical protein [Thermodesulfobacteriota bacterium]
MFSRVGIFVVVVAALCIVGSAWASPPVPPPAEGFGITTAVDIEMSAGDCTEIEGFTWTWVHDTLGDFDPSTLAHPGVPQYLGTGGRAAQIRYTEELATTDTSFFQLNKDFAAASEGEPNLKVAKNYGYVASEASLIANATNKERVGLSIVANGDREGLNDMPSLCPWVATFKIPATNEFIAAGSNTSTTSVMVSDTDTDVLATKAPELNHTISAVGVGNATALMKVELMEGGDWYRPSVDAVVPDLVSKTSYSETSSATGAIEKFTKAMHYHSTIPAYQMPEPWYQLQ